MRFPSLELARRAQFLRERREEIVRAWEEAVSGSPVARPAEPALRDVVRPLLDRIGSEILGDAGEAKELGGIPAKHDLDVRAVLAALGALRGCVLGALVAEEGSLDLTAVRAVDRALGGAADEAARGVAETHAALLRGLDAISRASLECRSVDELLAHLLDAFVAASRDVTTVTVLLREGDELRVRATVGLGGVERGMTFPIGEGLPGTAAAGRPPMRLSDAARDSPAWNDVARRGGVRATHGVPLVHDGEVIGVAQMGSTRVDAFPLEDIGLFESMASRAALGIARHLAAEEARRASRERREAQALLEALFEAAPVGLAFLDRDLRYVRVNRWVADANGLPVEAHVGRTPLELLPTVEGLDAVMARWREIIETGRPWIGAEIVGETRAHPGERRTWREDFFPVRMGGEIVGLGAVIVEVTEERRANDELSMLARLSRDLVADLELEPRLRRAVEIAIPAFADWCALVVLERGVPRRAAVAGIDREQAERALEMLERAPADLATARGLGRVLREGVPDLVPDVDAVLAGERELPIEARRILRRLGIRSYLAVPLRGDGGVAGVLGFGMSASGRRFDERSLRFGVELARRISLALENARLFEAARREARVREQVLAVVSHDLRTPLSTILTSTRRIELAAPAGPEGDALRRTAETVRRAAGRMERLIGDLLDVAAIQGGSLTVAPEARSPGDLLHEAADAMGSIARESGISLEVDVAPHLPPVLADHDRILQVLANLFSNAVKVTPPGGRIGLRAEVSEGAVRFAVEDTGPGIPPEEREQLFDPYWRGAATEYKGTGLGLAIARGIVAAHRGSIGVEGEPGAGATFWFTLPLAPAEEAALRL